MATTAKLSANTWWLPLALAALSLIISAFVGYNRNDRDLASRVAVLEAHQEDAVPRLDRIEGKLDQVDSKIETLSKEVIQGLSARGVTVRVESPTPVETLPPPHTPAGQVKGQVK